MNHLYRAAALAAEKKGEASTAGPNLLPIKDWLTGNVYPVMFAVLILGIFLAVKKGQMSVVIAVIACVVMCGFLLSGGALDLGKSLGGLVQ